VTPLYRIRRAGLVASVMQGNTPSSLKVTVVVLVMVNVMVQRTCEHPADGACARICVERGGKSLRETEGRGEEGEGRRREGKVGRGGV
jgi:hypothetical protein